MGTDTWEHTRRAEQYPDPDSNKFGRDLQVGAGADSGELTEKEQGSALGDGGDLLPMREGQSEGITPSNDIKKPLPLESPM